MTTIRPYAPGDLDALYEISLKTGDRGGDATALYAQPRIMGEIYAAPYAVLAPHLAFVAEDQGGVAGYVLGVADTRAFEAECDASWWPGRRAIYPDPGQIPSDALTLDQRRAAHIHRPKATPQSVVDAAPAHLHINLLPRLQGQGMGKTMIDAWLKAVGMAGARHVHLGCNAHNQRALRFYDIYGFQRREAPDGRPGTIWMTIAVP